MTSESFPRIAMEQNASAHTVLRIQEICDYITDFLHSSSTDLNSCALISRLFTAPAQYHLFSDIDATWYRFGDPSVAASASQRLCTVLLSAHLVCLVRRLRLSLCPEIIVPLAQVRFTRLETLRLDGGPTMARVSDKTLSLAAGIVGLPSIRCVQFVSVVLNDIESLGALFRQRSTLDRLAMDNTIITSASPVQPRPFDAGQHRVVLNSVEITDAMGTAHDSWVVHALCPFDFSAVRRTSPKWVYLGQEESGNCRGTQTSLTGPPNWVTEITEDLYSSRFVDFLLLHENDF
ncbi:hypothetical protein B0H13DRAFT_1881990 [Mycena leptocephala]|nr:hypothetical protein B0H13DRAFT_1881990 [Mycena leptocephala]